LLYTGIHYQQPGRDLDSANEKKANQMARLVPLGLILLGILCAIAAALRPVSRLKGKVRLLASLFGGAGVGVDSLTWIAKANLVWPAAIELAVGVYLIWTGLKTYRKDPEGKAPATSIY
jgi:hypothetical protein